MSLGERLKIARERVDLKQVDVAKITQINNKTLSNWEKNVSKPDADNLRILAALYNVSADYILELESMRDKWKGISAKKKNFIDIIYTKDIDDEIVKELSQFLEYLTQKKSRQGKSTIA